MGTAFVPVMSGAEPPESRMDARLFYNREPDTLLSVFNSPFGPDVLVATDRLSEGIDLHRWCRFLVHFELDPTQFGRSNAAVESVESEVGRRERGNRLWRLSPVFTGPVTASSSRL